MITREYIVALINGDYAILEDENKEQISIARALLPMEIDYRLKNFNIWY